MLNHKFLYKHYKNTIYRIGKCDCGLKIKENSSTGQVAYFVNDVEIDPVHITECKVKKKMIFPPKKQEPKVIEDKPQQKYDEATVILNVIYDEILIHEPYEWNTPKANIFLMAKRFLNK